MNGILDFEHLKIITGRTGRSATRAQVSSDLEKMGMDFATNLKGDPISTMDALNNYILGKKGKQVKSRTRSAADDKQSDFQVLKNG